MVSDREMMDLHIRALFTHDDRSRLLSVNESGNENPAPRMFLGRTPAGNVWRFRADLPETLVEELKTLCADEPVSHKLDPEPRHFVDYLRLLETHAPMQKRWMGPAYYFSEYPEPSNALVAITGENTKLLRGNFEDLIEELPAAHPFVAIVENGRAISVCRSVRITAAAHEAGVETLPEARGSGYATDVTAGWARLVQSLGAIPLYSTSWDNTASQAVAKKLRLIEYGADFHVR